MKKFILRSLNSMMKLNYVSNTNYERLYVLVGRVDVCVMQF